MVCCDLHLHSTASDGTESPVGLVGRAVEAGLAAIALTDHDTTAGLGACAAACDRAGIAFLAGIEFSARPLNTEGTFHLLGYGFDADHRRMIELTDRQRQARRQRIPRIVERLNELGVDITFDEVADVAADAAIGRPHVARVLIAKGYVKSIRDAFVRYIGPGAPAYVPKPKVPIEQAIDTIHDAGGLAVLAHPVQMRCADEMDLAGLIGRLKEHGLDGLECYHPDHSHAQAAFFGELAERFDLLVTGGSDYHGRRRGIAIGSQKVPLALYQALVAQLEKKRA